MFLRIEPTSGIPITRQIMDQIRLRCASGSLSPGDRLPSVRELARELTVNQNTVLRVYERLTHEGLLERRHGDGTYVAQVLPADQARVQHEALRNDVERLAHRAIALGVSSDELLSMIGRAFKRTSPSSPQPKG